MARVTGKQRLARYADGGDTGSTTIQTPGPWQGQAGPRVFTDASGARVRNAFSTNLKPGKTPAALVEVPKPRNPEEDPEGIHKDLDDLYRDTYSKYQTSVTSKEGVDYSSGPTMRIAGGKDPGIHVPQALLADLYKAAKKTGYDPYKLMAQASQESSFGNETSSQAGNSKSRVAVMQAMNLDERYRPIELKQFMENHGVPGVKAIPDRYQGYQYIMTDEKAFNDYLGKNPKLVQMYKDHLKAHESLPDGYNTYEEAAKRDLTGIKHYNADPQYAKNLDKYAAQLKADPGLSKYLATLDKKGDYAYTAFADGGEAGYGPGGGTSAANTTPIVINDQVKGEWNKFQDFTKAQGAQGSKDLDVQSKNMGQSLMDQYRKQNPNTMLTYDYIKPIQQAFADQRLQNIQDLKNGKALAPGFKPNADWSNFMPDQSKVDGWYGSKTSSWYFPTQSSTVTKNGASTTTTSLYADGGEAGDGAGAAAGGGMGAGGYSALAGLIPALGGIAHAIFDGKPGYTTQPYVNASTLQNMRTPYNPGGQSFPGQQMAMGGETDPFNMEGYEDWLDGVFQNPFDGDEQQEEEQSPEDVYQEEDNNDDNNQGEDEEVPETAWGGDGDGDMFKHGGIYIKPSHRGLFTKAAKRAGMSVQGYAKHVLADPHASATLKKRANFARNAAGWKHAMGGYAGWRHDGKQGTVQRDDLPEFASGGIHINPANKGKFNATKKKTGKSTEELTHSSNPLTRRRAIFAQNARKWHHKHAMGGEDSNDIEVEGGEVMQTPDGGMHQVNGPSHEQGGVPVNVPSGTKIYSDRLQVDGKTMQERKMNRERSLVRIQKALSKSPTDMLLKNALKRTQDINGQEEAQDMAIQKAANAQYNANRQDQQYPKQAAAYGGSIGKKVRGVKMFAGGGESGDDGGYTGYGSILNPDQGGGFSMFPNSAYQVGNGYDLDTPPDASGPGPQFTPVTPNPVAATSPTPKSQFHSATGLTMGDKIGLAGNVFGAIAPLINTLRANKTSAPAINRYQGVGNDAIRANDAAEEYVGSQANEAMTDLYESNNASANTQNSRDVNVQRDNAIARQYNLNKGTAAIRAAKAQQMLQVLGQRGQLTNWRDQMRASGQTQADATNRAIHDNYYSNLGADYANLASNVEGIGRNLNTHQGNVDNTSLLEQMSQYFDMQRDDDGQLVLTSKRA